jgi:hypothetical protein
MHMFTRFTFLLLFVLFAFTTFSQGGAEQQNREGHYAFTPLTGWTVRFNGNESFVYAPADGAMDSWDEKVDFGVSDGTDILVEDAFDFYIKTDFPAAYGRFKLIAQGDETINGLNAKWATFTFSANGKAAGATSSGDSTISATLQAVFYLFKKDNSLYLVNGVTEKTFFKKYEPSFRSIIRTFRVKE